MMTTRPSSRILELAMRCFLSISMTMLLGFLLAVPLFADASSSLPQCCRRDGAHHCSGEMTNRTERSLSSVGSRCLAFPQATGTPAAHGFTPAAVDRSATPLFAHPAAAPQTEARYRMAFARSRQKRGPPAAATVS